MSIAYLIIRFASYVVATLIAVDWFDRLDNSEKEYHKRKSKKDD